MTLNSAGQGNRNKRPTSFKLVIVGTVALTAVAIAALWHSSTSVPQQGIAFFGEHSDKEIAFMQFLAKYGKTYATKNDLSSRYAVFAEHYDRV